MFVPVLSREGVHGGRWVPDRRPILSFSTYWSGSQPHLNLEQNPPFGRVGTSHGCVGLQDVQGGRGATPARWFYDNSIVGDVVIVKNSPDKTVSPDNGLNGWNMAWNEWVAGSAA